jgi:hypothetical protein
MSKKMTNAELTSENARLAAEIADLKTQLAGSANSQNPLPFLRSLLLRQKDYNHSRRDLQLVVQDGYDFLDADEDTCKRAFSTWMKEVVKTSLLVSGQNDEKKSFEGRKDFTGSETPTFMDVINISCENENYAQPEAVEVIVVKTLRDGSMEILRNPSL